MSKLSDAAFVWMQNNQEAMRLFETLALEAAGRGRKFGIGLLAEKIRWEFTITRNEEGFKIPNNHRAYIARELVRRRPGLAEFITFHTTVEDQLIDGAMPLFERIHL